MLTSYLNAIRKARELYFSARFDDCIDACRRIAASDGAQRSELALLTARAMLRLKNPLQATDLLTAAASCHTTPDAKLTSSMLLAAACTQRNLPDEALEILRNPDTQTEESHGSIHSEIELHRAYAHFAKRDISSALLHVLRIHDNSDLIHVQALEMQASCYDRLGKKRDAATSFVAALVRLDTCRQHDHGLAGSVVAGLARVTAELTDAALMQIVEQRYSTMEWPPNTVSDRCIVEINMMFHAVFVGDLTKAGTLALAALQNAPCDAMRAWSYAALATVGRYGGDRFFPQLCLEASWQIVNDLHDREIGAHLFTREAVLDVIQETAAVDVTRARKLFKKYKQFDTAAPEVLGSGVLPGREHYVEGIMYEAECRVSHARECFQAAYDVFRQTDSTLRAIESAYRLAVLGDDAMYWYVVGALGGMKNWMTEGLKPGTGSARNATEVVERRRTILATLTQPQREVVHLVCAGRSNPEIAKIRKTTVQTVKNMLTSQIFPAFGVSTRLELKSALADLPVANFGVTGSPHSAADVSFRVRLQENA